MDDENDDITLDTEEGIDDSVVAEESAQETIKKLRTRLKECESKAKEYLDKWQRAQADFLNLRKRDEEAKSEFIKLAGARIIEDLIPILDSFNIAISQGHDEFLPIYNQTVSVLKNHGLEQMDPVGAQFDPNEHEAIGIMDTDKEEDDHKVLEVLQKGYTLGGKVIRPAKVRIGQYKNS